MDIRYFLRPRSGGALRTAILLATFLLGSSPLAAQPSRTPPRPGLKFLDQSAFDSFTVQRWVPPDAMEESPSGLCECVSVVYFQGKKVVELNIEAALQRSEIGDLSGKDINGDGVPDLIVTESTGGAHCCETTRIYSMSPDTHTILSLDTGNCSVRFEDLDHDGKLEVVTCDDHFAYRYCSFAESPMPEVVFVFDRGQGKYIPATPRFPAYFQAAIEAATKESQSAPESKCAALAPVLQLMYLDRGTEATALFRRLYKGPDVGVLLSALSAEVKQSPMWVPR